MSLFRCPDIPGRYPRHHNHGTARRPTASARWDHSAGGPLSACAFDRQGNRRANPPEHAFPSLSRLLRSHHDLDWIAPSEKDTDNAALEKRLWDAADQFRANSGLKPQEGQLHNLRRTRDLLLPRLLSGQVAPHPKEDAS